MSDDPTYVPDRPPGAEDSVMTELRAIREQLAAEDGYDLNRMYARLKEIEEAERAAGREVIPSRGRMQPSDAAA